MIEVLVGVCILSTGVMIGASSGFYLYLRSRQQLLGTTLDAANKNMSIFAKAYEDSQTKAASIEQRLASLEFKMTGFSQSMGVKR